MKEQRIIKKFFENLKNEHFKIKIKPTVKTVGSHREEYGKGKNIVISIQKNIPKDLRKPYEFHEEYEDFLMREKGYSYSKAHLLAQHAEHKLFFPHDKKGWKRDLKVADILYRYNLKHPHECGSNCVLHGVKK